MIYLYLIYQAGFCRNRRLLEEESELQQVAPRRIHSGSCPARHGISVKVGQHSLRCVLCPTEMASAFFSILMRKEHQKEPAFA